MRLFLLTLFVFLSLPLEASATEYTEPTLPNLVRTLVRFHAVNFDHTELLDDYAMIVKCDTYKTSYGNDFKWNEVRQSVRKDGEANAASYPIRYRFDTELHLDRYDFAEKLFRFTKESSLVGINALPLLNEYQFRCGEKRLTNLPYIFRAVLPAPLTVEGLSLGESLAPVLLSRMDDAKNRERSIFARFNLTVTYIEPIRKQEAREKPVFEQVKGTGSTAVRLDARLDSIEFYEDPAMTSLIYIQKN